MQLREGTFSWLGRSAGDLDILFFPFIYYHDGNDATLLARGQIQISVYHTFTRKICQKYKKI